eukprot:1161925-Pelagomonas_calceolata.AAC.12
MDSNIPREPSHLQGTIMVIDRPVSQGKTHTQRHAVLEVLRWEQARVLCTLLLFTIAEAMPKVVLHLLKISPSFNRGSLTSILPAVFCRQALLNSGKSVAKQNSLATNFSQCMHANPQVHPLPQKRRE